MSERGLPVGIKMRHDSHYVEEMALANRSVGKILAIDKIEPNPLQPRHEIGDLTELTASILEQGVLEPLLVKPRDNGTYMIIAGERRWRASSLAGLTEVPCIELDIDEQTIAEIALVENLQRKDLTIWEVADGLASLTERFGYTHDDIAAKIGKSRTTVTESLAIAGLPKEIRRRCIEGSINAKSILVEVSRQFDRKSMDTLLDEILKNDLKRTQIREKIKTASGKAKAPNTKHKQPKITSGAAESIGADQGNSFKFVSSTLGFQITVDFEKKEVFSKKDVLIALKEAFDNVKTRDLK